MKRMLLIFGAVALIWLALPISAQVVREEGVKTIAGLLGETGDAYDDYTFLSAGNEILAVSVDSLVYDKRGSDDHGGEDGEDGGCGSEGGETGDEGGGCEDEGEEGCGDDGGPGGLCLQLLDSNGTVIHAVGRPRLPGWQRDPRMIVVVPASEKQQQYTVRIALADDRCGDLQYPVPDGTALRPYLLHASLRKIAQEGPSGPAAAASKNHF